MIACERKFRDVAIMLLDRGADPNVSENKQTPLKLAAANGDVVLVSRLLVSGADVNQMQGVSDTALHVAVDRCRGFCNGAFVNILRTLLKTPGVEPNALNHFHETPLYLACRPTDDDVSPNADSVQILLEHGADPNTCSLVMSIPLLFVLPPLSLAAISGYAELVMLLIQFGARLDHFDYRGRTALHFAVGYDDTHWVKRRKWVESYMSIAEMLLSAGSDVNKVDWNGASPLYLACDRGDTEFVKLLLSRGANPSMEIHTYLVYRGYHYDVMKPIESDESRQKQTELIQQQVQLLTNGADPDVQEKGSKDQHLCTLPLHTAAAHWNTELVDLLLKHGAKVNVTDFGGNTALHHAIKRYHPRPIWSQCSDISVASSNTKSVVDILLESEADVNIVNNSGKTPLCKAASRALLDVVKKMLQVYGGNPNKGSASKSPLVVACETGNVELVDTLLKHGADPNLTSTRCHCGSRSSLPLFVAVDKGNSDVVTSLLNAGADVNAMNHKGKSVVCSAAESVISSQYADSADYKMRDKLSLTRLLLQRGANLNIWMPDGHSPLYLAVNALADVRRREEWYRTVVIELLQLMVKHGAMLQDSSCLPRHLGRQFANSRSRTMIALATFDGRNEFIVDLFRAGAGCQLTAFCCNAVATLPRQAKSISLCQAAVLAGYSPSAEELQRLQLAAASDINAATYLIQQLVIWLNEDRQQVPSLFRQCRVVIRRQLSVAVRFQTILPAIDTLPLPTNLKLYLEFDGPMTEVDLCMNKELQTSVVNSQLSPYNTDSDDDYFYDSMDSDEDDYYYVSSDSDHNYFYDSSDSDEYDWW